MHAEPPETSLGSSSTPVSVLKERRFKLSRWAIVPISHSDFDLMTERAIVVGEFLFFKLIPHLKACQEKKNKVR